MQLKHGGWNDVAEFARILVFQRVDHSGLGITKRIVQRLKSNMTSIIRAVLFDAVGTLIYPDPSAVEVYFKFGCEFGSKLSFDEVSLRFHAAFHAEEQADLLDTDASTAISFRRKPTSEDREHCRWQRIVESVFEDVPDASGELFATLWNHFADSRNWRVFEDVPPAMRHLEQLGLVIGIASNFDQRLVEITQRLKPLAACKHVFCSSLVGYPKPSPEFFRTVEKELQLGPREILLIGDDWVNDYQAATSAGWQAVHLDRSRTTDDGLTTGSLQRAVELSFTVN